MPAAQADHRDMVWLLGQPHLQDYLSFCESKVVGGDRLDARALADGWRAANDYYYDLEKSEAGKRSAVALRATLVALGLLGLARLRLAGLRFAAAARGSR